MRYNELNIRPKKCNYMTNNRKTIFISDLHLEESRPDISEQFLALLNDAESADALYILGDLFEAWIGDDDNTTFHRKIKDALKNATKKGLAVYFMRGNRDFLIGKKFLNETGCILLSDEEKITVYGEPVLLMHGDTLCTKDIAYLKARKLGYNPYIQFLFLLMPLSLRRKFADRMRAKSTRHTQSVEKEIMDVTPEEVNRVMQKHQVTHLIHGHTHRPNIHTEPQGKRIVLAAWHDQGHALIWDETGDIVTVNLRTHELTRCSQR